jgi:hypothetical protein
MFGKRKNGAAARFYRNEAIQAATMLGERLGITWVSQKAAEEYATMIREWLRGKRGMEEVLRTALPEESWKRLVHFRRTSPHLLEELIADILD